MATKTFGLICQWGYVESSRPGFDVWVSTGGYHETPWDAVRSLASMFFHFYKEEQDYQRPKLQACCEFFQNKKILDVVKEGVIPFPERQDRFKFCLECGAALSDEPEFDPYHFDSWCYEQYGLQAHEEPHWYEFEESWMRDIDALFDKETRDQKHWFQLYTAERVLAMALPRDLIPESSREGHLEYFTSYLNMAEPEIQEAFHAWEETGENWKVHAAKETP
jgi:hypothetical protein